MSRVFITAAQARTNSIDDNLIHSEARALESAVLTAVDNNNLSVTIVSGTTMTDGNVYYNAYFNITNDPGTRAQVQAVEQYFLDLGYGVDIIQTGDTSTFSWNLAW